MDLTAIQTCRPWVNCRNDCYYYYFYFYRLTVSTFESIITYQTLNMLNRTFYFN